MEQLCYKGLLWFTIFQNERWICLHSICGFNFYRHYFTINWHVHKGDIPVKISCIIVHDGEHIFNKWRPVIDIIIMGLVSPKWLYYLLECCNKNVNIIVNWSCFQSIHYQMLLLDRHLLRTGHTVGKPSCRCFKMERKHFRFQVTSLASKTRPNRIKW